MFVCISPWNFPLAIFTGQVAAALAAGNSVVAKPAEQTPLVASWPFKIFHSAGIPAGALISFLGDGKSERGWLTIPASPASLSPARPKSGAPSTARSRPRMGRSCR